MKKSLKKNLQKNLKTFKTRELTKNEKLLLSILGIVVLFWLGYKFIYTPQQEKLASLDAEKIDYGLKIDEINATLRKENGINKEWQDLNREKDEIVSRYFPTLDQPQIIYMLNGLIENDQLELSDLNFTRGEYNDLGGFQVKSMDVSIPYTANYEGIIDTLNSIKKSPRKILVDNLNMDRSAESDLSGSMSLRIYSLEGIAESNKDVVYINTANNEDKYSPFSAYPDYSEEEISGEGEEVAEATEAGEVMGNEFFERDEISSSGANGSIGQEGQNLGENPYMVENLLDFEKRSNFFIPSQEHVKGDVSLSTNSKSKKYSLKLEYNIIAIEEENKAFVDVSRNNVLIKYPPNTLGMWVYSYNYSPATIGLAFRGQMGEDILLPMSEGIGWTGWKYIETTPPMEISSYPMKLESLYLEIPKNREDYGIILLDKLEALYNRNLGEDGKDMSTSNHIFHVVEKGESIEKISELYYGTNKYKNEIMKLNEIKPGEILYVGKVLVLKKP